MNKKYIVRLSTEERTVLDDVIAQLRGSSQKVRRAYLLRQSDVNGPAWADEQIAEAYHCRVRTVENLRRRLIEQGFDVALNGLKRKSPPCPPILDGKQEAQLIATRLGKPPKGYANWSLRLLANQAVSLEIVESISHETCRTVLKKMV